jgi:hypothetical protein
MKEEEATTATGKEDLIYKNNRELFYYFDKEKGYSRAVDYQYSANQTIIKQSWDVAEERLNEVMQDVLAGKVSPVAYYMEKVLMEVPMLAAYMEMPKWRIRRHLTQKGFMKLTPKVLKKYASVFDIPVEKLVLPEFLINVEQKNEKGTT